MSAYRVERVGPPPPRTRGAGPPETSGNPFKYPFDEMEIEESFLVSRDEKATATTAAYAYGKRRGKRFEYRVVQGGIRIWRVE